MPVFPNNIPTILIVDDEPFNLEFLELILKQQGYNIITATCGRQARVLAEETQPDLILLDIMMPDESGFECASVLRLSPETCEIPIVFLSALDDDENTGRGFDAGALDFIAKPFAYKDVIQRIRLHMKLTSCDRHVRRRIALSPSNATTEVNFPDHGARVVFPGRTADSGLSIHESAVLGDKSESHLLLNFTQPCADSMTETVKKLLASNCGPLFSASETMRNIGIALNYIAAGNEISAIYAQLDRDNGIMTVVNTGTLPAIILRRAKSPQLIERQSGNLGSLGMGLPPCSSYKISKGDRIYMFSREIVRAYEWEGEAINDLLEACHLSSGVDLKTACLAAAELLQNNGEQPNGILVGIEG